MIYSRITSSNIYSLNWFPTYINQFIKHQMRSFWNIMIDDDYIFSPGTSDWSCLTILKFEIKNPNVAKSSITIPSPSHANTLRQSKPVRVQGSRPQKVTLALGQRDGFQKRNSGQETERSTYSPGSQASTQQIHLCGKGCFQLGQKTRWRGKHVIGATEDVPVCRDANITRSATVLGKRASEAESRRFYKGMSQCSHRVVYSPSGRCHQSLWPPAASSEVSFGLLDTSVEDSFLPGGLQQRTWGVTWTRTCGVMCFLVAFAHLRSTAGLSCMAVLTVLRKSSQEGEIWV